MFARTANSIALQKSCQRFPHHQTEALGGSLAKPAEQLEHIKRTIEHGALVDLPFDRDTPSAPLVALLRKASLRPEVSGYSAAMNWRGFIKAPATTR